MASRGQGLGAFTSALGTLATTEDLGSVFGGGDGGYNPPRSKPYS